LRQQLDRGLACTPTTSMGRLFDAVAAIVGGPASVSFEAEAALWLESQAACCPDTATDRYRFRLSPAAETSLVQADWRPVVEAIVGDLLAGVPTPEIAAGFHRAVTRMIDDMRQRLVPHAAVGLTGGVFQNALLVEQALARLRAAGRDVLLHHLVPPNDGGLALGQALLARRSLAAASFSPP
jgi:hydrogenase maturation protein HypF